MPLVGSSLMGSNCADLKPGGQMRSPFACLIPLLASADLGSAVSSSSPALAATTPLRESSVNLPILVSSAARVACRGELIIVAAGWEKIRPQLEERLRQAKDDEARRLRRVERTAHLVELYADFL